MMCQRIGLPPISTIGFGFVAVSSLMRVPRPPAKSTALTLPLFISSSSEITHFGYSLSSNQQDRSISVAGAPHKTRFLRGVRQPRGGDREPDLSGQGQVRETRPRQWSRYAKPIRCFKRYLSPASDRRPRLKKYRNNSDATSIPATWEMTSSNFHNASYV